MADSKISQLTQATTSGASDLIPIVQGGVNKKSTPDVMGLIYSNPNPTTASIGGIPAGTILTNETFASFIDQAGFPYLSPAFTAFSITGAVTQEVGQKITGVQTFTWTISNIGNVQANSINIYDTEIPQTLITGHSTVSPATFDFSTLPGGGVVVLTSYPSGSPTAGVYTWRIEGTNTNLILFNRDFNLNWMWRMHSGMNINATLTNAQILALANSSLATVFPPQVATAGGGYFWYWVPSSFIQPTIFKDHSTGFAIAMEAPVTQAVTNAYSIVTNYKGYRSTNTLITGITVDIT